MILKHVSHVYSPLWYSISLTDADREKIQLSVLSEEDVASKKYSRAFCSLLYSEFEKKNKKETKQAQLADIQRE